MICNVTLRYIALHYIKIILFILLLLYYQIITLGYYYYYIILNYALFYELISLIFACRFPNQFNGFDFYISNGVSCVM